MGNPFARLTRSWKAILDGPELTQADIDRMNAQGQADTQEGLEKMKRPVENDPERK